MPPPTAMTPQRTDFTKDILGRFVCNGLDEALASCVATGDRPDARPFDVIVIGGGSFGPILAEHLFTADKTRSHRVLVLDAGPMTLPEHVQNLPMIGLAVPTPVVGDPGPRAQVWGLPWRSDVAFPGLAYTVGGRSLFFGGWAPELLDSELTDWPLSVRADLQGIPADGSNGYFRQASQQIGVTETNDFISGNLHLELRKRLFDGVSTGEIIGAVPLDSPDLALHLDGIPVAKREISKLEAPLAVQARAPRSGFFPLNKFSSVPLIIQAARTAAAESQNDDSRKRFMIVPNCHVIRLRTQPSANGVAVTEVETNIGNIAVAEGARVVLATGTIESTRLALDSFPTLPNSRLIGTNLMAHLRSNLTIRINRKAFPANLGRELSTSALFVKGRHPYPDGTFGHFHLQITAAGLKSPNGDSEAELFKKNPNIDLFDRFLLATDDTVVITIRGIGEMQPKNAGNHITLPPNPSQAPNVDEYGIRRAIVTMADPNAAPSPNDTPQTIKDRDLWDVMDGAADDAAMVFAKSSPYEVLVHGTFQTLASDTRPSSVLPFAARRDGLGTTHHEAGTLWMGDSPAASVTDSDGRFHYVDNAFAVGPMLHPTVGSPNPMLTGTALARRQADHFVSGDRFTPDVGYTALFDGADLSKWQMSTIRNQPGRDNPGSFRLQSASIEVIPGTDIGLLWHNDPTPADFSLRLEWRRWDDNANSGVFIRFPDITSKGFDNTAYVAVDFGFEIQIDQLGRDDGSAIHRTAAIYGIMAPNGQAPALVKPPGQWNKFEIRAQGQSYDVVLNGTAVTHFVNRDAIRGLASTVAVPSFVGLQTHSGRVDFRHIEIKPL